MSEEKRQEILKALAYGLDEETAARCNGVTLEEVQALVSYAKAELQEKQKTLMEAYPDAF